MREEMSKQRELPACVTARITFHIPYTNALKSAFDVRAVSDEASRGGMTGAQHYPPQKNQPKNAVQGGASERV